MVDFIKIKTSRKGGRRHMKAAGREGKRRRYGKGGCVCARKVKVSGYVLFMTYRLRRGKSEMKGASITSRRNRFRAIAGEWRHLPMPAKARWNALAHRQRGGIVKRRCHCKEGKERNSRTHSERHRRKPSSYNEFIKKHYHSVEGSFGTRIRKLAAMYRARHG